MENNTDFGTNKPRKHELYKKIKKYTKSIRQQPL